MGQTMTFGRKTALVAMALVLVMFAGRIGDFSSGFDSEFLVYGQTAGGGTGDTGTAGGPIFTFTRVIPHVVVGVYDHEYKTVIQVTNTTSAAVTLTGNFYKQDGTASTVAYTTSSTTTPSFTGTLTSVSVAANSVLVITGASTTPGTVNWARFMATGAVSIAAFFEARTVATTTSPGDRLVFRVGIGAVPEDATSFMVPRIRNAANLSDAGFAIVNTGATAANITATLKSSTGTTIASRTMSLAARQHTSDFSDIFFKTSCTVCIATDPAGTNFQYVVFTGTAPQFAAVGLAFEANMYTSLPVDRLQ